MKQDMHTKKTILLIDDDTNLLETLQDFLSYEGYRVVTAESGEKALTLLRRVTPDIILLDMSMTGMGGVGFLERITNPDGSTRFPVLVLTARATMAEYFATREIDGFVAKPCCPDDLLSEVNRIIFLRGGGLVPAAPAALDPANTTKARRAVLAEGDVAVNTALRADLQRAGFHVEAVFTGPAALELAVMSKPDVMVMRLELTDMSAQEVLATLRRLPNTRDVPVVVYGIAAPDALIEHVAQLDLDEIVAIKDCETDKIVNAALSAAVKK